MMNYFSCEGLPAIRYWGFGAGGLRNQLQGAIGRSPTLPEQTLGNRAGNCAAKAKATRTMVHTSPNKTRLAQRRP